MVLGAADQPPPVLQAAASSALAASMPTILCRLMR
jgi:hypothetical protein